VLVSGSDPGMKATEPDGRSVPLPGSRPLVESDISKASFDVTVRGGVEAIDRALTGSGKFVRAQTSDSHPVFQYRSQ